MFRERERERERESVSVLDNIVRGFSSEEILQRIGSTKERY